MRRGLDVRVSQADHNKLENAQQSIAFEKDCQQLERKKVMKRGEV